MDIMDETLPWSQVYNVADLPGSKPTFFDVEPDAKLRAIIAEDLELTGLSRLKFKGDIRRSGADWVVDAQMGASIVQPCVVTLEPVKTRIDDAIERRFVANMPAQEGGSETEMPDDISVEPLGDMIDIGNLMVEALLLRLPMFPRADGVEPVDITVSEPGVEPLTKEKMRPFAGLKSLRDKMENPRD